MKIETACSVISGRSISETLSAQLHLVVFTNLEALHAGIEDIIKFYNQRRFTDTSSVPRQ